MIAIRGYQVLEHLYDSPRSLVYRARKEGDGQPVILKLLHTEYPDARDVARFKREYEITRKIDSEQVIRAYEQGKSNNSYYLVLEDIDARTLENFVQTTTPDVKTVLTLALEITTALDDIHRHNIVHKDLNLSNVVYNPETCQLKVIDFGIATELSREMAVALNPGGLEGTLHYIAPEQSGRMNRGIDYRSDFYSFGVMLYRMLAGRLPFESVDPLELIHCHIAKTPMPPSALNPDVPEAVSEIVLKLLKKTAEERYQSAFGLKYDIQACLERYARDATVAGFTIAQHDISHTFQVTQQLYGRETEIEQLMTTFEEVAQGAVKLLFVSGYAGVGKSALVHEIEKPIVRRKGYFIEGKFDQFQHDVPYNAVIKAFRHLIAQLLSEPEERLALWKHRLLDALETNGQLMIDLIPQLETIIGRQPPIQEVSPIETQNRFLSTFRNFISVFAQADHPLVIFLDDLQWADIPTLHLLQYLLKDLSLRHFLALGAYRGNEVDEGHPLMLALEEFQKIQPIRRLTLTPLNKDAVAQIIADTLYHSVDHVAPLTEAVYQRTEGNPFFVAEILTSFYQENLIAFNRQEGVWGWDLDRIVHVESSEHVVDLMLYRLKKLPGDTQTALQLAACIGNEFDLKTLSLVMEQSATATATALWEAIHEGVVIPLNAEYQLVHLQEAQADADFDVSYRFRHDRIQQAAYSLVENGRKNEVHLRIGRLMIHQLTPEERDARILDIVHHLNAGAALVDDASERMELARLNMRAGQKAKASTAYAPALQYFRQGKDLLPENAWEAHYAFTFEILREYSICAYFCGDANTAEQHCQVLLKHARTPLEQAEIRATQLMLYSFSNDYEKGIQAAVQGLHVLGVSMAAKPGILAILKEFIMVRRRLGGRKVADLVDEPISTSPEIQLCMKMLFWMISPAFLTGNTALFAFIALKQVTLSLTYGNNPESAPAFATYAVLLTSMGALKTAYKFGKLGIELSERFEEIETRCRTLTLYTMFCHSWKYHWKEMSPLYKKAVDVGFRAGEFLYMGHAGSHVVGWNPTLHLEDAMAQEKKYIALIKESNNRDALDLAQSALYAHCKLRDGGREPDAPWAPPPEEVQRLERMQAEKYVSGVCEYHIRHLTVYVWYGAHSEAYDALQNANKTLMAQMGTPYMAEICAFGFLAIAALWPDMPAPQKALAWIKLRIYHYRMKRWARYCAENFLHWQLLMEAEMARLAGQVPKAESRYEAARKSARDHEYWGSEALANELAARFYLHRDLKQIAGGYVKAAYTCYSQWGADAKAAHLERAYPQFLSKSSVGEYSATTLTTTRTTDDLQNGKLDLSSVLKASQAISSEIVLENLLKTLLQLLIENAGAQRGTFLFNHDQELWKIELQGTSQKGEVVSLQHDQGAWSMATLKQCRYVCPAVVSYVIRARERVILADARHKGPYTQDAYIVEQAVKSVLCIPFHYKGALSGVLYLENNLVPNAFTEDRIQVLQALLGQAAISIENASLYTTLEQKVRDRTVELQQAHDELAENHRKMTDNLRYASRIQYAVLPRAETLTKLFPEHCIFYRPCAVVSGDFYWVKHVKGQIVFAAVDCTGHGVSGGLVSMLGIAFLNEIVPLLEAQSRLSASSILDALREHVKLALQQRGTLGEQKEGMDLALCIFDPAKQRLQFAGAHNPLYLIRDGRMRIIKADRMPIGVYRREGPFTNHELELQAGDRLYLSSDGYLDQNGPAGEGGLGRKRFQQILLDIHHHPMSMQQTLLKQHFERWKGDFPQRDDVLVFGLQL